MSDQIELTSVDVKSALKPLAQADSRLKEESLHVKTRYGNIFVTIQGNRDKTPIVTFPDIGLNSITQYHGFFNFVDNEPVMDAFCAYHINALGQEDNAPGLPTNYPYPTCDQMAEIVLDVVNFFKLKGIICFGIGLGANILARFALIHPDLVRAIVLINCVSTKAGWIEWGYQKWNNWYLSSGQLTEFTKNYLLWHHFGYDSLEKKHDLGETYSRIFSKINPINLGLLINTYITRTDLGIERNDFENQPRANKFNFKCQVLNVMGDQSPHDDDVVDTNGRLDPTKTAFVKFADCGGMVLEEQPAKLAEALRHFLQGLGFLPHVSVTRYSVSSGGINSELALKQKILADQARRLSNPVGLNTPQQLDEDSFKKQFA